MTVTPEILPTDAAYLAGVLDGEGSISIWKGRDPRSARGFFWKTKVCIAQSDLPFLEEIREIVGSGKIRENPTRHTFAKKRAYVIEFNATTCRWLLPQLIPFLRIKRKKAEMLMRFYNSVDTDRNNPTERAMIAQEFRAHIADGMTNLRSVN